MGILISHGGPFVGSGALKPTVCASFTYDVDFELTVTWKGECVDTASVTGGCLDNVVFCVPRGDYRRIIASVVDLNGDAVDISGFTSIEYVIANDVDSSVIITKSLGSGIVIGGDNASFVVTLEEADTALLTQEYSYQECRLENGPEGQTIFAGFFRSPNTILGTS